MRKVVLLDDKHQCFKPHHFKTINITSLDQNHVVVNAYSQTLYLGQVIVFVSLFIFGFLSE